jgi:hypothetical protein
MGAALTFASEALSGTSGKQVAFVPVAERLEHERQIGALRAVQGDRAGDRAVADDVQRVLFAAAVRARPIVATAGALAD